MKPGGLRRAAAVWGLLVTAVMILVKIVPWIPGHFTWHEWLALAIWGLLGAGIRATRRRDVAPRVELETNPVAPLA
jgi:hypothetical protein